MTAKEVIERDHAMHLGARQTQAFREQRHGALGNEPKVALDGVQDLNQRPRLRLQQRQVALDRLTLFGRKCLHVYAAGR